MGAVSRDRAIIRTANQQPYTAGRPFQSFSLYCELKHSYLLTVPRWDTRENNSHLHGIFIARMQSLISECVAYTRITTINPLRVVSLCSHSAIEVFCNVFCILACSLDSSVMTSPSDERFLRGSTSLAAGEHRVLIYMVTMTSDLHIYMIWWAMEINT